MPSDPPARNDASVPDIFEPYLDRWNLVPDGAPITALTARLLPVRWQGEPAMLRVGVEEEHDGGAVMEWWDGAGTARVLARGERAIVLERAMGTRSLSEMARTGDDDEACRVLCAVAERLHTPRVKPHPPLTPLAELFAELEPAAAAQGGVLVRSAETARALLAEPQDVAVLHGDLHHDNVLDFGARGWLAIDPRGLLGERGFDYANIFTNPDLSDPEHPVATLPGRFAARLEIVCREARLERERQLRWILAWCGLSAAWFLGDGDPLAKIDLQIAELAAAELDR